MPFELNLKNLFKDFNQSKFAVYTCLLIFTFLFALRLDGKIQWSYWVVFLPIWIWKMLVIFGCVIGNWVWWRHPQYRQEADSCKLYKAMMITTGLQMLLFIFELLVCDKLESHRKHVLWTFIFIPVILISIISIFVCIWAVKSERTFELELFCSVNILQFIFLALRLDGIIKWKWVIVCIPVWIVMCFALIGVLYAIILALILLRSQDISQLQRRSNVFSAVGYTFLVVPLLVFQILLVYKEDGKNKNTYFAVTMPLYLSLFTLAMMSFGAKPSNQWWFGLRKEFCPWLLGVCPFLQEYGNISYKIQNTSPTNTAAFTSSEQNEAENSRATNTNSHHKKYAYSHDESRSYAPPLTIDVPD